MQPEKNKKLSNREISMIKGLLRDTRKHGLNNRRILGMFSVPDRTINAGRISEIKASKGKYSSVTTFLPHRVKDFVEGKIRLSD